MWAQEPAEVMQQRGHQSDIAAARLMMPFFEEVMVIIKGMDGEGHEVWIAFRCSFIENYGGWMGKRS